jgi:molecular chaperone GrpE
MQDEQHYEESGDNVVEDRAAGVVEAEERLRAAEEQARTYLANWQRAQADLENYRKRAQQERREATEYANSTLLAKLMSAFDDLERAFSRPVAEMRKAAWADGAKLSFQKLKGALESEGVQEIEALGQPFDPRFHQAVMRRTPGSRSRIDVNSASSGLSTSLPSARARSRIRVAVRSNSRKSIRVT